MKKTQAKGFSNLQLLECTLRDGSYAVDFRFTHADTALLCRLLSGLGFKYLEVGHGLGINASKAGKGEMPSTDEEIIKIAKSNAKGSLIGMFCIPNIAHLEDLRKMTKAGLDFVRIGNNAEDIEKTFPYIEVSRNSNMHTFLNFMKSYAITPKEFARKAKKAAEVGAQVIYLVDSAGCMLPEEVDEYIRELKEISDVKIGFHGHNNLHLAVANTLQAVKSGADFVDTTLYGIGRNAGNAPTEVLIAALKSMEADPNIDLIKLMDVIDRYISPLMRQIQMYDMLSVTMGLAKFHSSFLPQLAKIADEYKVDLRKLILEAGKSDSSNINEARLIEYAKDLKRTDESYLQKPEGHDLVSFYSSKIRKDRISNTLKSIDYLMEELVNVAAKRRARILLEILPAKEKDADLVFAEYVTSNQDIVMGRVKFGSVEILDIIMGIVKDQTSFLMIDNDAAVDWLTTSDLYSAAQKYFDSDNVIFYSSGELLTSYASETMLGYKNKLSSRNLLIIGSRKQIYSAADRLSKFFDCLFVSCFEGGEKSKAEKLDLVGLPHNCVVLDGSSKGKDMNLNVNIALSFSPLSDSALDRITGPLMNISYLFFVDYSEDIARNKFSTSRNILHVKIDVSEAYKEHFIKWMNRSEEFKQFSAFRRIKS